MNGFILGEGRTTPSCPYCRCYDHVGHAENCEFASERTAREQAERRLASHTDWYQQRFNRLRRWVKEEVEPLSEEVANRYFSICANGSADPHESPDWRDTMHGLTVRAKQANRLALEAEAKLQATAASIIAEASAALDAVGAPVAIADARGESVPLSLAQRVERLGAEVERLRVALEKVAAAPQLLDACEAAVRGSVRDGRCVFCGGNQTEYVCHLDDCEIVALLAAIHAAQRKGK